MASDTDDLPAPIPPVNTTNNIVGDGSKAPTDEPVPSRPAPGAGPHESAPTPAGLGRFAQHGSAESDLPSEGGARDDPALSPTNHLR